MHITELRLDTQNFQEQLHFYTNILSLPLKEKTSETFAVQAGTTHLTFRETTKVTGYHFAFTIPSNTFSQAKEWLATRTPLLTQSDKSEFFLENWNSNSLYFRDAANHIKERYYTVHAGNTTISDGAWTVYEPFGEFIAVVGHISFWDKGTKVYADGQSTPI